MLRADSPHKKGFGDAPTAGTMAGGKRIIKTMGSKIIRITPLQGFAAETSYDQIIQAYIDDDLGRS